MPSPTPSAPFYIDAHMDVPWLQTKAYRDEGIPFDLVNGHPSSIFTVAKAKMGGLSAAIFALYLSEGMQDTLGPDASWAEIEKQYQRIVYGDGLMAVTSVKRAKGLAASHFFPVFFGLEGGRLLGNDLTRLTRLAKMGVRYLTLTHNRNTDWADSATDTPLHNGLTPFGHKVVKECNRLGILIDVSHASDNAAINAIGISTKPCIASHSAAKGLVQHPRNASYSIMDAIVDSGGVICVPYAKRFIGHYKVADHIDELIGNAGISYVGIGSDIDGAALVPGFDCVSQWKETVANDLIHKGYAQDELDCVLGGNLARVLNSVKVSSTGDTTPDAEDND